MISQKMDYIKARREAFNTLGVWINAAKQSDREFLFSALMDEIQTKTGGLIGKLTLENMLQIKHDAGSIKFNKETGIIKIISIKDEKDKL